MALYNTLNEIKKLIPEGYGGNYQQGCFRHAPESEILLKDVYAIVSDETTSKVESIYKAMFVIYRCPDSIYLIISNQHKEINSATPSVVLKTHDYLSKKVNPWGFEEDGIGLHIKTNGKTKKTLYFGNSFTDIGIVANWLVNQKEKAKTVVTEVVYA